MIRAPEPDATAGAEVDWDELRARRRAWISAVATEIINRPPRSLGPRKPFDDASERVLRWAENHRQEVVYFVSAPNGLVKIGTTRNLRTRFGGLCSMSPVPLALVGADLGGVDDEARLHRQFADDRSHGEWFRPTDDLRSRISRSRGGQ